MALDEPRAATPSDLTSLSRLVDIVFRGEDDGGMFRMFPTVFTEANLENVLIITDGDTVVSHVGMTERWACLGGCTVRVACLGAVATYEEYRGRGLATRLLDKACDKALAGGVDFMLISGGRGMYRRAGAADVGREFTVTLPLETAVALTQSNVTVEEFHDSDLPDCVAAYNTKEAHFIRPAEDWQGYLATRSCMTADTEMHIVRIDGAFAGYFVAHERRAENAISVAEFAGEPSVLVRALKPLMERFGVRSVQLHLQANDRALKATIEDAGASVQPTKASGTMLVLDFQQLMRRFHPFFEQQVGREAAKTLSFEQDGGEYRFCAGEECYTVQDRMAAAEVIFGNQERELPDGLLRRALPVPALWYGLNFV